MRQSGYGGYSKHLPESILFFKGGRGKLHEIDLIIGEEIKLSYPRAREPVRYGLVVGLYERFFNVHFGWYQESFLWVDLAIGQLNIVRAQGQRMARAN